MLFPFKSSFSRPLALLGLLGLALVQVGCAHPVVVEPSVSVHSRIGHAPVYGHVGVPGPVYYAPPRVIYATPPPPRVIYVPRVHVPRVHVPMAIFQRKFGAAITTVGAVAKSSGTSARRNVSTVAGGGRAISGGIERTHGASASVLMADAAPR